MQAQRKSFYQQEFESPRGQIDGLWRKTRTLMSTAMPCRMLDEEMSGWHERIARIKRWADRRNGRTGIYPNELVQKFLAKFS